MKTYPFVFLSLLIYCSCNSSPKEKPDQPDQPGEFSSSKAKLNFISSDTTALAQLISFKFFKPDSAKFSYTMTGDSDDKRIAAPGTADYTLEAVLYFDAATFRKIITEYSRPDWSSPGYQKEEFDFEWLDASLKQELLHADSNYHGHIDLFFTDPNDPRCHIWMLNQKLLLHKFTQ